MVKRNMIWNSTMEKLMLLKPAELALDDFKIEFENEEGWDAGYISYIFYIFSIYFLYIF